MHHWHTQSRFGQNCTSLNMPNVAWKTAAWTLFINSPCTKKIVLKNDRDVTFSDLILQHRPCVLDAIVFFRFCSEVIFILLFPVSSVCSSHGFSPMRYSTQTSIPLVLYCNHSTNPPSRVDAGSRSENTEELREREEKEKWRGREVTWEPC